MHKQCLKTTVATVSLIVGSLISACANSGGKYEKVNPRKDILPANVTELSPDAVKWLTFSGHEVGVVFVVDKEGNVQVLTPPGSIIKTHEERFPLRADHIKHMNTITTFETTNPKTCWLMHGTLYCINW